MRERERESLSDIQDGENEEKMERGRESENER